MSYSIDFISPRLTGKRFDDHAIPIDLLEDFAAFEELLIQVAKFIYLEENQDRQRVPRGFTEGVSLKLSTIGEGSAIPKIILVASMLTSNPTFDIFPNDNISYFEKARDRIIQTIDAAQKNNSITYIPQNLLGYFNKIGKRLKDDETIDFSPDSTTYDAKLNTNNRKKIVLSNSKNKQFTNEIVINASIPEVDKNKCSFTILYNDQRISADIPNEHYETILKAFNEYEQNSLVLIKGIGKFNNADRLESFESIEQLTILDPLDVTSRLEYLSKLQDGWFNSEGIAPTKDGLEWFASFFESYFDKKLPLPMIFPTIEGGIQAEWSNDKYEISLNIDLNSKTAFYQLLDVDDDETLEHKFDLNKTQDWSNLNSIMNQIFS